MNKSNGKQKKEVEHVFISAAQMPGQPPGKTRFCLV
jgi:hypothetical protein